MAGLKRCTRCKKHLLPDLFSKRSSRCKPCASAVSAEWREKNTERYNAWQAVYRTTETAKAKKNGYRIKYRYGISVKQLDSLLDKQQGKCAICGIDFPAAPHIDHCHETGLVRGLLCDLCNRGLGYFRDSTAILQAAASYLRNAQ